MIDLKAKVELLYIKAEVEVVVDNRLRIFRLRMISQSVQDVKDDLYKVYGVEPKITSVRPMHTGIILHDLALQALKTNIN